MRNNAGNAGDKLNSLFTAMLEDLNDKSPEDAPRAFAVARQVQRMRKRAKSDDRDLHLRAIADFISCNSLVGDTVVSLSEDVITEAARYIEHVLERFTTSLDETNIQQSFDPSYLESNWKFGPGASNGVKGTHTAEKIVQNMTCTILCKPLVTALRGSNSYFQLNDERNGNDGTTAVRGSRLATVPKNETTNRTIAIEPSGNMALQLAAGSYIEGALRMIGLDIHTQQPKNKAMAKRGSIDGSIATIDLKSASDMFTPFLIRKLWPRRWYRLLSAIRSDEIDTGDSGWIKMNMISTMGNGFTFPLMTLSIVALIYAYRRLKGGPNLFIDWSSTCVFGDDIIIPVSEYEGVVSVLSAAGLVVNNDKSYCSGPFRESCGGDYFEGYDVTPFYVRSLDSDAAVYVAINQVFEWSARHNLLLHRTLNLLRSFIAGKVHLVPEWHNPDEGVLTASVQGRYTYLQRLVERRIHKRGPYDYPLAVGGYLVPGNPDNFFTPRLFKQRWRVRKSRLPNGYLDGADPVKRSACITHFVSAYSFLFEV
ncbi:TPA_asm: RNA-directed RNA polymerase [ssRNA phage Gephyllon.1_9]|uniref:RNA-directed RNA polymerase n=2 Tax=Norzivirales TaxID=2842247 RepID=A0A8S5L1Z5_9VIRU|nr:RNA-directed RNA polymerase [ssRNA phage Gephyllon.1_9]QDH87882.1 MAG: RNA-dependent RNA polymerase [Leviviridae sp.]DAD51665.1 TPA_asm: RNA-directed RNA polymerase [ssRNA phage Gephyllon.1_9]